MPAEVILIGIISLVGVLGTGYLLRPRRLRRLACEKARTAVAAAAPLVAITGQDYLRASQVQQWLDLHPRYKRLVLSRRERRRLTRDSELKAAYDFVSGLFDFPRIWAAERNEAYVQAQFDDLDDWLTTRLPYPGPSGAIHGVFGVASRRAGMRIHARCSDCGRASRW
jgi:hypothetical protein